MIVSSVIEGAILCHAEHGIASSGANRFSPDSRQIMTERTRTALPSASLDQLFRTARTHNAFEPDAIPQALLHEMYELAKWGPTASNGNPARFVFLVSEQAKARLAPHMSSSNRPRTLAAPVNVIMAYDVNFWERTPFLFPHKPESGAWFSGNPQLAQENALRNGSLQAAYLMFAARSLGLDCGPMSGFKDQGVNDEFFVGTTWRANFICNIGHGTTENLFPRLPRLSFEDACQVL
jgi:nitroreductase